MKHLLDNPVFHALQSGDALLGSGTDTAKFFDQTVSPFAGIADGNSNGFDELYQLLPENRTILFASRNEVKQPAGWTIIASIEGLQFLYSGEDPVTSSAFALEPLEPRHVDQMVALARLTKPGPFDQRTIEFGQYYGIFDKEKLVAMTGQRLHVYNYTEISAVCTHPDYIGKGYGAALIQKQLKIICSERKTPFLHVRADNDRAIALYERLGFTRNGPMNFYFLKKDRQVLPTAA